MPMHPLVVELYAALRNERAGLCEHPEHLTLDPGDDGSRCAEARTDRAVQAIATALAPVSTRLSALPTAQERSALVLGNAMGQMLYGGGAR